MKDSVLILTPLKDVADLADSYCQLLAKLTYPHEKLSLGLLESDSQDDSYEAFAAASKRLRGSFLKKGFQCVEIWQQDFDYHIPADTPRWAHHIQLERRSILARSRNHLLSHALRDQDWVLWLDADVTEFPPDIIEQLLSYQKDILQPHCVKTYGGATFDQNASRELGTVYMDALRGQPSPVELHLVGGTMLLVRADLHRDGLHFPPYLFGATHPYARTHHDYITKAEPGEIETEGLAIMAHQMGHRCWGLPDLEIIHRDQ
jgi:hypothetical protein